MSNEKKQEIKIYTPLDVQKDYEERGGQFSSNIPLYVLLNEIDAVKSERDRLVLAGNEFIRLIYTKKDLIHLFQGEWPELVEALITWQALTRKEGKDGE